LPDLIIFLLKKFSSDQSAVIDCYWVAYSRLSDRLADKGLTNILSPLHGL